MPNALISGVTGQDGAYLAKLLLSKGYKVFGTYRRLSTPNFWRLQYLGIADKVQMIPADLLDSSSIVEAVRLSDPDEVYALAAQSFVGASFEQPEASGIVTGVGVTRVLEAVRQVKPSARLYNAATSEMYGYGGVQGQMLDENTPFRPASPYAAAKLYGYWMTRCYREGYGMFAVNGILMNHESPLRGLEFVTRKVSNAAARIKVGLQKTLELGNLDAARDWGYAPEYVECMWRMLQMEKPDDFVIATGEAHTVRELVDTAFQVVGLDWHDYVVTDAKYTRPIDVQCLCGDAKKARRVLGWEPKMRFHELVETLVLSDLARWNRWRMGEMFPWDAGCYPDGMHVVSRMQNRGG